jgi:transcriptional regulator with XRE-family HTH domain
MHNSESLNFRAVMMLPMARAKTLPQDDEVRDPILAQYVYEHLSVALKLETALSIAKRTKVAASTLSNIRRGEGKCGVGQDVATRLLPVLGHKTYRELLSAAYAAARPEVNEAPVYPSLAELLSKNGGRWSSATIAAARASLRPPKDPGEQAWARTLDGLDIVVRDFDAQTRRREEGDPLSRIERKRRKD